MKTDNAGFTLIELMIAVVIIAIIAAIALPAYDEYVRQGNRTEAKAALLEAAQALERFYSVNGTYLSGGSLAAVYKPAVPTTGATLYTLAPSAATATSYELQATGVGRMAGDACGVYVIRHTGEKALSGNSKSLAQCW